MILGGINEPKRPELTPHTLAYVGLILNPFFTSAQQMATRAMKNLNDAVVSAWSALSLLIVMLPISLIMGYDLSIIKDFSLLDLTFLVSLSVITITAQTLRFMAISNHPLTGLQPFTFLMPMQQFLTDVVLFNAQFTGV